MSVITNTYERADPVGSFSSLTRFDWRTDAAVRLRAGYRTGIDYSRLSRRQQYTFRRAHATESYYII